MKISLLKKFILIAATVVAAIMSIIFFNMYRSSVSRLHRQLKSEEARLNSEYSEKGELLTTLISQISPLAMMSGDQYTVNTYAEELLKDPDVVRVVFFDQNGNTFLTREGSQNITETELLLFKRDIVTDPKALGIEMNVGKLEITIHTGRRDSILAENEKALNRQIQIDARSYLSLVIVVILILSITLYILLKRVVISPIRSGIDLLTDISTTGNTPTELADKLIKESTSRETYELALSIKRIIMDFTDIVDKTEMMADGIWNIDISPKSENDKLRNSLKKMVAIVRDTLSEVKQMTDQVDDVSTQLTDAGVALAAGANDQAGKIDGIGGIISELIDISDKNITNISETRDLTISVDKNATTGKLKMENLSESMSEIKKSSEKIQTIIKTIDDIAFQTNLLALNAAVEAARAGSHGKGFAVVADEVRSLASRSAKAAMETASLIETTQNCVEDGVNASKETSGSLETIVLGIAEIKNSLETVNNQSDIQRSKIDEVAENIILVGDITQQNSATSEETAAISQELSSQSSQLRKVVKKFNV